MQLKNLCTIRTGLVLSRKQANTSDYRYVLFTLRAGKTDGSVDPAACETYFAVEPLQADVLAQKDDIIVRLSSPYTAFLITAQTEGFLIPSSFLIIRPRKSKIDPSYLWWHLNSEEVKKELQKNNTGNIMGTIRPAYYQSIDLPLPPLVEQHKIGGFYRLCKYEEKLLKELQEHKICFNQLAVKALADKLTGGNAE